MKLFNLFGVFVGLSVIRSTGIVSSPVEQEKPAVEYMFSGYVEDDYVLNSD